MAERGSQMPRMLLALLLAAGIATVAAPADPAGAKLTLRQATSKQLGPKDEAGVQARCPNGPRRHVISGGYLSKSPLTEGARSTIAIFRSAPTGERAWKVGAANFDGDPGQVKASVLCAKEDPRVRVRSTLVDAPAGAQTAAVARCPKGLEAIAGGFSAPESKIGKEKPEVIAVESRRKARNNWRVVAYNNAGDADGELKVWVSCSAADPGLRTVVAKGEAVDRAPVELAPSCPRSQQLWSGGFVASFQDFHPDFAAVIADGSYADGRSWVSRFVGYQAAGPIKAYAYCRPR